MHARQVLWLQTGGSGKACPRRHLRDFPGDPVVKNLPFNAGPLGLIPGWGTKIPHTMGQRSPLTETREAHLLQEDPVQPKLKKKKKAVSSDLSK